MKEFKIFARLVKDPEVPQADQRPASESVLDQINDSTEEIESKSNVSKETPDSETPKSNKKRSPRKSEKIQNLVATPKNESKNEPKVQNSTRRMSKRLQVEEVISKLDESNNESDKENNEENEIRQKSG